VGGEQLQGGGNREIALSRRLYLWTELFVLFVGGPAVYVLDLIPLHPFLIKFVALAVFLIVLWRDSSFDRSLLWNARAAMPELKRILLTFVGFAFLMLLSLVLVKQENLFNFPRQSPLLWAAVLVAYPVFSVYPQEIIYRPFFFHRYHQLLSGKWAMIAASAVCFSYMHIIFENPLGIGLTLVGGFLFSLTYWKTRSTVAAAIEHSLYGLWAFTIGFGEYIYPGTTDLLR
jgi:membrane protease YdiL (CAAX protease family)